MLAHPLKRARSTSPPTSPNGISSPLDILLKRRRRDELVESFGYGYEGFQVGQGNSWLEDQISHGVGIAGPSRYGLDHDHHHGNSGRDHEEPEVGVERRRRRQWEKAQAPAPGHQSYQHPIIPSHPSVHTQSDGYPHNTSITNLDASSYHSPISWNNYQHSHPQTIPNGHEMSSSPIRHRPPGSSPFKASKRDEGEIEETEELSIEEMRREWGDEYASQNTLLHSLHMSKINGFTPDHSATSSHLPSSSPYHQPTNSFASQSTAILTPQHPSHLYPYESHQTPGHDHTPSHLTPYRHINSYFPSSSPSYDSSSTLITGKTHSSTPFHSSGVLDVGMESDAQVGGIIEDPVEEDVRRRYEETNRLLGELAVARRRRWGEGG